MKNNNSIHALFKLMDDPNQKIRNHAKETLLGYGTEIIPTIKQIEAAEYDDAIQMQMVQDVLRTLRFRKIKNELKQWIQSEEKDLMEALYLVCNYQFPEMEIDDFMNQFQALRHRCWLSISSKQTSFEKVHALNNVFFHEFNFQLIEDEEVSPFDFFVNAVINTKKGTGFSIGLIYTVIAHSLNIPIYGVVPANKRMPFTLAYLDTDNLLPILNWEIDNNGVLFYIEISEKGTIIDPQHLKSLFDQADWSYTRDAFEPTAHSMLIKEYIHQIQKSYQNHPQYRYKLDDIAELLLLFEEEN